MEAMPMWKWNQLVKKEDKAAYLAPQIDKEIKQNKYLQNTFYIYIWGKLGKTLRSIRLPFIYQMTILFKGLVS